MNQKIDEFFKVINSLKLGLSFGDVRLETAYSDIDPATYPFDLTTKFSRNVPMKCPIVSSPMDRVTESTMAIAMAKKGCIGIIHRGLAPKEQASEVDRVKFEMNGLIEKPITVLESDKVSAVLKMIEVKKYPFHSFPVLDNNGLLVGSVIQKDFKHCLNNEVAIGEIMTKNPVTAEKGIDFKQALDIMQEKDNADMLFLLDSKKNLAGMYVFSDVKRIITGSSPINNIDRRGNLYVGAAIGVGDDAMERAELLIRKKVDVLVIDTAHANSKNVVETLKELKRQYPTVDVVVGNISTEDAAKRLAEAGADGLKVGQGPGSICTTRMISGIGAPQITAVYRCSKAVRGMDIPVCADGGVQFSGDIPILLGVGANNVMLGMLLAGTDESPGEVIITPEGSFKEYRGMGSLSAMQDSKAARDRYGQGDVSKSKLVPEGIEGRVPYMGKLEDIIYQLVGGLKAGMGYLGARSIKELQEKADFIWMTSSGLGESHPHNITITKTAPNYKV